MTTDILARYQQAQALMQGSLTNRVTLNDSVFPHWIGDSDCFWYIRETRSGREFRLVDAKAGSNTSAFDHEALASVLTSAAGKSATPENLPLRNVSMTLSPVQVRFHAWGTPWRYQPDARTCSKEPEDSDQGVCSPDGTKSVFVRDFNLWVRDLATGQERALTTDGALDYCYASPYYLEMESRLQVLWSPDSRRVFTVQRDVRKVTARPYIQYAPKDGGLRPQLTQFKRSYPGDEHVESCLLVVIDVGAGDVRKVDYPALPYPGFGFGFFTTRLGWWSKDSQRAYFFDVTRGSKKVRVVELNVDDNTTRVLIEETANTYVKLAPNACENPLFLPLPDSEELIWFSERSGWGQLYLYDLTSGKLKRAITQGEWLVRNVLHFDATRRELLIQTAGRDESINPYYRDICRVNIDSGDLTPLAAGNFEHLVYLPNNFTVGIRHSFGADNNDVQGVSPSGNYLVETRSRVDTVPVSVLIDRDGSELLTIETADLFGLPKDWRWPEPVKLKAADGETDIYGVVYRPPGFSPEQRYPVVDFSIGRRDFPSIPHGSFINSECMDFSYMLGNALAALGFIVVVIEGRGTPNRSKAFHDHHYGDVAFASDLNDRVAGIRQLAERHPYMDIERVGITGLDAHAAPVYGLLNHPDFYKVGVAHGLLEPWTDRSGQGEIYNGIPAHGAPAKEVRRAENHVEALCGKLLLLTGGLEYTTPSSSFRLIEALQKANKDFDMVCLPNADMEVPAYAIRRNWDYLVKHLQGIDPPREFSLTTGFDVLVAAATDAAP